MARGTIHHIALVSQTSLVARDDLDPVAAALQKQVTRDLEAVWGIRATVDSFSTLDKVPIGYWPLIIVRDVKGAAGIHLDRDGQPFALAEAGEDWSLTASHECLEMLVDPVGNRLTAGRSKQGGQGRVQYLVEVSDPSEAREFGYRINDDGANGGILVSDFYTPRFFDSVNAAGNRYSFTGAIKEPLAVLKGGYLSWTDPTTGKWWQETWFGPQQSVVKELTGFVRPADNNVRWALKKNIWEPQKGVLSRPYPGAGMQAAVPDPVVQPTTPRARDWQQRVSALLAP